jgi:hypothetical protein
MLGESAMLDHVISAILVIVGIINFVPVAGVMSSAALAKAYGIDAPTGDVLVLLRHRAVLLGIVGGFICISAFLSHLQVAAVGMAYVSMLTYVQLAWGAGNELLRIKKIDVAAIMLLSVIPVLWMMTAVKT